MAASPRVSVIIPTCNRVVLLGEAIDSVLRQSFRDLEVLVCDDGSTDGTAVFVQGLGPPVRYLGAARAGRPGPTRNRGIEAARGELIAFLDDDDLWEPEKLARQIELLEADPSLNFVYTDRRLLFADGSRSAPVRSPSPPHPERLLEIVVGGQSPCLGTVLLRRETVLEVRGFDETLLVCEELDLWLRLARIARAGRVPEPLVVVRRRAGTLSDRAGPLAFETAIRILEGWLAGNDPGASQRWRCRRTLAHLHTQLAAILAERGHPGSRRTALRAIRHAPWSRAAWIGAGRAWLRPP